MKIKFWIAQGLSFEKKSQNLNSTKVNQGWVSTHLHFSPKPNIFEIKNMNTQAFLRSSFLLLSLCFLSIQGHSQTFKVNNISYFDNTDTLHIFGLIGKDLYPALEKLRNGLGTPSSETDSRIEWREVEHKGLHTKVSVLLTGEIFTKKEKKGFSKPGKLPTKNTSASKEKPLAENQYQSLQIDIRHSNDKRINSAEKQQTIDWLNGMLN